MSGVRSLARAVRAIAVTGAVAGLTVLGVPTPAPADPAPVSFFAESDTPAEANWNESGSLELGVRFHSDVAGTVTAVRFYKGDKNTGTHTGSLWTETGEQLATATFADESASGWQQVTFAEPVPVDAGVTYVASYHTSVGFYSATVDAFAGTGLDKAPLHIPANGGSFHASGAGFPTQQAPHNYWVDVVFVEEKGVEPTPTETETVEPTPTATATAAPPAEGGGGLPVTGANGPVLAGGGLLLAAIGALLVWRHRRRTTRFVA